MSDTRKVVWFVEFEWWSWSLSAAGITVQILAGTAPRWAWIIGLFSQVPWCVFAVVTDQWGFLPSSLIYAAVYAVHWWRVERARRAERELAPA